MDSWPEAWRKVALETLYDVRAFPSINPGRTVRISQFEHTKENIIMAHNINTMNHNVCYTWTTAILESFW